MSDDDKTDWDKIDSDWLAEHRPDKLSELHRQRLLQKHGQTAGAAKFHSAVDGLLRRTQLVGPYRKPRGR